MNGGPPIRELSKDIFVQVGTDLLLGGLATFGAFCHNDHPDIKGMVTGTIITVLGSTSFTIGNNRVERRLAEAGLETNHIASHLSAVNEIMSS